MKPEEALTQQIEEMADFVNLLIGDASRCVSRGKPGARDRGEPDQFWARMLVRAFFAAVEGLSHGTRKVAVAADDAGEISLTPAERWLLTTEEVYLTDKGEAKTRQRRLPTRSSILFSLDLLARFSRTSEATDRGGKGFNAIVQGLKVRDRITHPKAIEDVQITWDEVELVRIAADWLGLETKRFARELEKRYSARLDS